MKNLGIYLIILMIFGYQLQIFFQILTSIQSQIFTILFRAITLFTSLLIILIALSNNKLQLKNNSIILISFWILYTLRFLIDIEYYELYLTAYPKLDKYYYYSFTFGAGLIPTLALIINPYTYSNIKLYKAIYSVSFLQIISSLLVIYLIFGSINDDMLKYRFAITNESGNLINPITIGKFGVIGMLVSFSSFVFNLHKSKFINIIFFLISSVLLFLSGSRGPTISLIFGLIYILIIYFKYYNLNPIRFIKIITWVLLPISSFIYYIFTKIPVEKYAIFYRIMEFNSQNEVRTLEWKSALNQFLTNPLLGDSMFNNYDNTYAHNVILESFMATGILGGILFLLIYVKCIINIFKIYQTPQLVSSLGILTVTILSSSLFSGGLYFNDILWGTIAFNLTFPVKK